MYEDEDVRYRPWCALFEQDPNDPVSKERFDAIKDELPSMTLPAKEFDRLVAELDEEPKVIPSIRELMLKGDHPFVQLDAHDPDAFGAAGYLLRPHDEIAQEEEDYDELVKNHEYHPRRRGEKKAEDHTDLTPEQQAVVEQGEILHAYANHFDRPMWRWTRDLDEMTSIRFSSDYDKLRIRIKRALKWLFQPSPDFMKGRRRWWENHVGMAFHALKREDHLPDGQFREGPVYAVWEEDGEYIQMVQPIVGSLVAEFLIAEPDHPHAQKIAAKMAEIAEDYTKRLKETPETD